MKSIDFVICPQCKSKSWYDRIALGDSDQTMRFTCTRCKKMIKLSGCTVCNGRSWIRENDLYEKESKKPIVRYRCSSCSRIIGLYLDHDLKE